MVVVEMAIRVILCMCVLRMRTVYSSLFVFIALMDLLATRIYSTDTQQSLAISTALATVFCFESNTLSGSEREEAEEGKKI